MKPTVSVTRYRRPSCSKPRVVGSSVSKSRLWTETSAPVSALSSVDFPTFVYPARATVGVSERRRDLRLVARCLLSSFRRRLRTVILRRARRRAVWSWLSPGPRLPPRPHSAPYGSRPAAEALEVLPHAAHAREVVLELRQLDLELALRAPRVLGEDVEDQLRPVDDPRGERVLELPLLRRTEVVVDEQRLGAGLLERAREL